MTAPLPPHPRIWWDGSSFLYLVTDEALDAGAADPGFYRARTVEDITASESEGSIVELRAHLDEAS